jgi:hypothetical protein
MGFKYFRYNTEKGGQLSLGSDWYGFAVDNTLALSVTRIGNLDLHRSLPIQEAMTAVLLQEDGTESYALKSDDWDLQADGVTASDLSGADGDVMIKIPNCYYNFERKGDIDYFRFSEEPLFGMNRLINLPISHFYVSAYEAGIDRTNNKLVSIVNDDAQFRGGNNNAAWDLEDRTLLGRPVSLINRTDLRTAATNKGAGWAMNTYGVQRALYYLFILEFGTRDSQAAVNGTLDANGFKQGGLGAGVTNLNSTAWNTWNSYYPFVEMGYTNGLGTGTGEMPLAMPSGYGSLTTNVNRYRGIELPFGHIWKNTEGINLKASVAGGNLPFVTDDLSLFNDVDYEGFTALGQSPSSNGSIQKMLSDSILPLEVGTNRWGNYYYQGLPATEELRTVRFGGVANSGSLAGFGTLLSGSSPSNAAANFGSRLCFFPI